MALKQYLDPTGLAELISKIKSLFIAKSGITTGTANGTINVAGTDVAVKGLGSNAYSSRSLSLSPDVFGSSTDRTALSFIVPNTENITAYSQLGVFYPGYYGRLKSIRLNGNQYVFGVPGLNYGSCLAFGGSDTIGIVAVGNGTRKVSFFGGIIGNSNTAPSWNFSIAGDNDRTYYLPEITKLNSSSNTSDSSSIAYDFDGSNSIDTLTLTGSGSQTITINTIVAGYEHRMLLCNDTAVNKRIFIAKDSELTQTLLFPSSISVSANGYKLLRIVATDNHIICTLDNEIGTTQL